MRITFFPRASLTSVKSCVSFALVQHNSQVEFLLQKYITEKDNNFHCDESGFIYQYSVCLALLAFIQTVNGQVFKYSVILSNSCFLVPLFQSRIMTEISEELWFSTAVNYL